MSSCEEEGTDGSCTRELALRLAVKRAKRGAARDGVTFPLTRSTSLQGGVFCVPDILLRRRREGVRGAMRPQFSSSSESSESSSLPWQKLTTDEQGVATLSGCDEFRAKDVGEELASGGVLLHEDGGDELDAMLQLPTRRSGGGSGFRARPGLNFHLCWIRSKKLADRI